MNPFFYFSCRKKKLCSFRIAFPVIGTVVPVTDHFRYPNRKSPLTFGTSLADITSSVQQMDSSTKCRDNCAVKALSFLSTAPKVEEQFYQLNQ
jgi:hypothetical protein